MSFFTCLAWGYLLYTGNINTLWRMLGISNQLLAAIALAVGTTYLLNHAPKRSYAFCTAIPFVFTIVTVLTAGVQSVMGWWRRIPTAPAAEQISLQIMCWLASVMLVLTVIIVVDAVRKWKNILATPSTDRSPLVVTETA
jgi:carbon starvation protein